MLEHIICIISACCLMGIQRSCFLLIHMVLNHVLFHHLDHFVTMVFFVLYFVRLDTFCDFRSIPKSNELFKNYIYDILFHNIFLERYTIMQAQKIPITTMRNTLRRIQSCCIIQDGALGFNYKLFKLIIEGFNFYHKVFYPGCCSISPRSPL